MSRSLGLGRLGEVEDIAGGGVLVVLLGFWLGGSREFFVFAFFSVFYICWEGVFC